MVMGFDQLKARQGDTNNALADAPTGSLSGKANAMTQGMGYDDAAAAMVPGGALSASLTPTRGADQRGQMIDQAKTYARGLGHTGYATRLLAKFAASNHDYSNVLSLSKASKQLGDIAAGVEFAAGTVDKTASYVDIGNEVLNLVDTAGGAIDSAEAGDVQASGDQLSSALSSAANLIGMLPLPILPGLYEEGLNTLARVVPDLVYGLHYGGGKDASPYCHIPDVGSQSSAIHDQCVARGMRD